MAVVTAFHASHLQGVAALPEAHHLEGHPSYTLWNEAGCVLAAFGCVLAAPGWGLVWMVLAPPGRARAFLVARQVLRKLRETIAAHELRHLEAHVAGDDAVTPRFLVHLGFAQDGPVWGTSPTGHPLSHYVWHQRRSESMTDDGEEPTTATLIAGIVGAAATLAGTAKVLSTGAPDLPPVPKPTPPPLPATTPPPLPPPPTETQAGAAVGEQKRKRAQRFSVQDTLLASPLGASGGTTPARTLLGG